MVEIKKIKGGSFKTMDLNSQLFHNIAFDNPTPIQRKTIPLILENRSIMGIARTGSGKTLCYLIPAVQKAINGENTMILLPTKELVIQVKRIFKILSNRVALKGKVEITTLKDLKVDKVDMLVVDEIDRILEEQSLLNHFNKIIDNYNKQRVYFSATLPNNPIDIPIVQIENKIPENIKHNFLFVPSESKESALLSVLNRNRKTIIFVATRYGVEFVMAVIQKYNFQCKGIYSSMDDEARKSNFDDFRLNRVNFLVVTDVAARGIDIPHLDVSISYDLSDEKTFVHRVGRVRGMGEQYSFVTYSDVFHFFNIKETHLPGVEIGRIPQSILDQYDMKDLKYLKYLAMRGYQRCLDFRRKVSVPSEYKMLVDGFKIHSNYKTKETLADQLKEMRSKKPEDIKKEEKVDEFKDQFYIPYCKKEQITHCSAFGVSKDDFVRERKVKDRGYKRPNKDSKRKVTNK